MFFKGEEEEKYRCNRGLYQAKLQVDLFKLSHSSEAKLENYKKIQYAQVKFSLKL